MIRAHDTDDDKACWTEGRSFKSGRPEEWSQKIIETGVGLRRSLHPDGERFAVRVPADGEAERKSVVLLQNFFDYLKQHVPPDR